MISSAHVVNVAAVAAGVMVSSTAMSYVPLQGVMKPAAVMAAGLLLVTMTSGAAKSVGVGLAAGAMATLVRPFVPLPA